MLTLVCGGRGYASYDKVASALSRLPFIPSIVIQGGAMLLLRPRYCVAFPGGSGTNDMVEQCEAAGVTVWRPYGK